jgi:excinuclease ABC subunit B
MGIRVRYLHSDIGTLERMEIIRELRAGAFDVLVGINLLREGLDIPEVSLVAILDADKEGFLRSNRSLIQTCGRAARNSGGLVIMYADSVTKSMRHAIEETARRREIQKNYNKEHGVVPRTIRKEIQSQFDYSTQTQVDAEPVPEVAETVAAFEDSDDLEKTVRNLEKEMAKAAKAMEFEKAAEIRDRLKELKKLMLFEF